MPQTEPSTTKAWSSGLLFHPTRAYYTASRARMGWQPQTKSISKSLCTIQCITAKLSDLSALL